MPNRNNAADTDAPLPLSVIESSNVPVENDNGEQLILGLNTIEDLCVSLTLYKCTCLLNTVFL